MINRPNPTPHSWQMIIPAASALAVALIGLGSAIYQTDKPIQLTAVALTAQAATQAATLAAPAPPLAAAASATDTLPAPAQASPPTPAGAASGPGVLVANRLALPVRLYLNGAFRLTLEAGGLESLSLPAGSSPADLRWSVVRPAGAGGAPLGGELGGTFRGLKAGDELAIASQGGEQPYFYPIVSNTSSKDCKVTIDDGWTSEAATGVVIPARQEGVALGYDPLYSYSNVTLECGGQFYWWGLRPNEKNRASIYYEVAKESGVIQFTIK